MHTFHTWTSTFQKFISQTIQWIWKEKSKLLSLWAPSFLLRFGSVMPQCHRPKLESEHPCQGKAHNHRTQLPRLPRPPLRMIHSLLVLANCTARAKCAVFEARNHHCRSSVLVMRRRSGRRSEREEKKNQNQLQSKPRLQTPGWTLNRCNSTL